MKGLFPFVKQMIPLFVIIPLRLHLPPTLFLPVGVHKNVDFNRPRGEHRGQNPPTKNHFHKVIFYPDHGADTSALAHW